MTIMPVPLITGAIRTIENVTLPDSLLRFGVQSLIGTRERSLTPSTEVDRPLRRICAGGPSRSTPMLPMNNITSCRRSSSN